MNPEPGDFVKVLFHNGLVEEGIVVNWTDEKSAIRSHNNRATMIIQRTLDSVFAVQIIHEEAVESEHIEPSEPVKPPEVVDATKMVRSNDVYEDHEMKPDRYYEREDLRAQSLVNLRRKISEVEREKARRAITTFEPTGLTDGNYNPTRATIPGKLQSISQHTKEKTGVGDFENSRPLTRRSNSGGTPHGNC